MQVSLTTSNDILDKSVSLIDNNENFWSYFELSLSSKHTLEGSVGLPLETLNTLQKLAESINNDGTFFYTITMYFSQTANQ